jgi:AraC-like DNA-binding protein
VPFSHRHHHFAQLGGKILLDRLITPSYVLRRCELDGFLHDERLSARALGYGTKSDRARLVVMLEGRGEFTAGAAQVELGPGEALLVSSVDALTQRGATAVQLELDWDPDGVLGGAPEPGWTRFRLAPAERKTLAALAQALGPGAFRPDFGATTDAALSALESLGLPLRPGGWRAPLLAEDPSDQSWADAIDAALSDLGAGPASTDLERRLAKSRSTVSRGSKAFHDKLRLTGLSGPAWRSVRDFYRLLVGTIVMGHPEARTQEVAHLLGYRSAEAFCHAFAHAGLPSPGLVRETVRRL